MFQPLKVLALDLERPLETIENLEGYGSVFAFVRMHGLPIGTVTVPVRSARCEARALGEAILARLSRRVLQRLLQGALRSPVPPGGFRIKDLLVVENHELSLPATPLVTVAVCTRDRAASLALCLDALSKLDYPALDLLVVDNAPSSDATERLVRESYPRIRYVREARPGLDWARNRAIQEARGEIIAYTDDDAVADPNWVRAIVRVFVENAEVMAVTGLVLPYELETEAQFMFERYGGFSKGFGRQWYRVAQGGRRPDTFHIGAGRFGTGANMAFRKEVFSAIGGFDPALDVGTVTNGGGDLEIYFRVLQEGYPLVYEPAALVWHRHRREYAELKRQIETWGTGAQSHRVRSALVYGEARMAIVRYTLRHLWSRYFGPLFRWALLMEPGLHVDLLLAELKGAFLGLFRYQQARARAVEIIEASGSQPYAALASRHAHTVANPVSPASCGIRQVDLAKPIQDVTDVTDLESVRILVACHDRLLGHVTLANHRQMISADRVRESIASRMPLSLLNDQRENGLACLEAETRATLREHYVRQATASSARTPSRLSKDIVVSIVVATYDRPESLSRCLRGLSVQQSDRLIEIVVVDNHPASARTPPVIAEFPGVRLVNEPRQGLSYARNAGIGASRGHIVVATDDDVVAPPEWLERLLAPFADDDVMVVTGNVLPVVLDNRAQNLFETYGGVGRGHERIDADALWFASPKRRAVRTWQLGGAANAAFRAAIFLHPGIGLFNEALGAGTPTGCGEDAYYLYRVLKAGYRIVYEPDTYVCHMQPQEMRALWRQIYNYGKGHVAYHLTTLLWDHDLRALTRLLIELPLSHLRRAAARLLSRGPYPLSLIATEAIGNLVGPVALWRARRRVKQLGRSAAYVPAAERN